MKLNFSKTLIYATLAILGGFLAFWLRAEFLDEKNALETEMQLNFVEDLIGLEKTDVKEFFKRKNHGNTEKQLTLYDSSENRQITFFSDTFSQGLKDSIKLIIRKGVPVWNTKSKLKIKRIDVAHQYYDSMQTERFSSDTSGTKGVLKMVETSSENFKHREAELNLNAAKGIMPQAIFAVLLYSLLLLGFFLLQKNHRQQQLLLENKNSLIRNITHELQTPIATIAVALEAIQNFNIKNDKVKTNEYINTSRKQLKNLSDSIDRVMEMSKMDARKEVFHFEKIAIFELAGEAINDLKIPAEAKNITLDIVNHSTETKAKVDKYHFKNVLFNLVDNAVKYGKKGGKVEVILDSDTSRFYIKVKDNGCGIARDKIEKIFERFYRITEGNRHDVKGYGLGLSYAKQVVEAHGGTISVTSQEGKGSIFELKIPLNHE